MIEVKAEKAPTKGDRRNKALRISRTRVIKPNG